MKYIFLFIALMIAPSAMAFDAPTNFDSQVIKMLERGPVGMAEFTERVTGVTVNAARCDVRGNEILEIIGWVQGGTPQPIEDHLSEIDRNLGLLEYCFKAWNEARALKEDIMLHGFDETLP